MNLILYRRDACSLCDYAETALRDAGLLSFERVDIGWDGDLAQSHGWRIPVLRDVPSGRELDWPFDSYSVRAFIKALCPPAADPPKP